MRAATEGIQRLSATVLEENTASKRMLQSAGFRVVDRGSGSMELSLPLPPAGTSFAGPAWGAGGTTVEA
jgi:hypothetical protein